MEVGLYKFIHFQLEFSIRKKVITQKLCTLFKFDWKIYNTVTNNFGGSDIRLEATLICTFGRLNYCICVFEIWNCNMGWKKMTTNDGGENLSDEEDRKKGIQLSKKAWSPFVLMQIIFSSSVGTVD